MLNRLDQSFAVFLLLALAACQPDASTSASPNSAGSSGTGAGGVAGSAGTGGVGVMSSSGDAATTGSGGSSANGGAYGSAGIGGQGGASASAGQAGASGGASGGGMAAGGTAGSASKSSCPLPGVPLCLDFEGDSPLGPFQIDGDDVAVTKSKHQNGGASLSFSQLVAGKSAVITTTQLDGITSVLWGRFYLYMDAGAPDGHGAFVNAFDQAGNWYELGFQFSAFHGNWHPPTGVPERWMNSASKIRAQAWTCVEFAFDGSKGTETQIWSDGVPVEYTQKADSPTIQTVSQFKRVSVGFVAYHGTSLSDYSGDTPPRATQMYLDDLALGPQRIGCE